MLGDYLSCGNCEFYGIETKHGGWYCDNPKYIGSPLHNGGTNTIIYENTRACKLFIPKNWERPTDCSMCALLNYINGEYVYCKGYPFYLKVGTQPCENGKLYYGTQLSLF